MVTIPDWNSPVGGTEYKCGFILVLRNKVFQASSYHEELFENQHVKEPKG